MDPSAAAAASRTFVFLSGSALTAAFSASTFPVKRPRALTAFGRFSAFSFFSPSRNIAQAFSAVAFELGNAVLPACSFAAVVAGSGAGACAKAVVPTMAAKLMIPVRTRFDWRPIQDCLLFISVSALLEELDDYT